MRRVLTTLGATGVLIGLPLAASAHDGGRYDGRGYERHGHYKPKQKQYYAPPVVYRPAPAVVYRPVPPPVAYYPVPRPVYVPAPPAAAPGPWPFNQVDIGFRIFF